MPANTSTTPSRVSPTREIPPAPESETADNLAAHITDPDGHSDIVLNNAHRISDGTDHSYIDQDLTTDADPTFGSATVDHLDLNTGAAYTVSQGQIAWNADEETIDVGLNGATLQAGQEIHYHVRNNSGADIEDGRAVMATGTIGNSGRITIGQMDNTGAFPSYLFLGITTETIANDSDGKVTHFGKIRGIQTDGANYSETWIDGDLLYLDPVAAGALTKVPPEAPRHRFPIAIVIKAHGSNGTLFIRVQPGHAVGLSEDVQITSVTDKDQLVYNGSTSRWENAPPSYAKPITEVSTSTVLDSTHYTVLVNASAGAAIITLPAAASNTGRIFYIKKIDGTANTVVIDGNGSETIDNNLTAIIRSQYVSLPVQSDGANWWIL